jgi:hypothetical protein
VREARNKGRFTVGEARLRGGLLEHALIDALARGQRSFGFPGAAAAAALRPTEWSWSCLKGRRRDVYPASRAWLRRRATNRLAEALCEAREVSLRG